MKKRYGKPIDLTKLKPNVLNNLKKHRDNVLKMIEFLGKNHKPITQKHCYICRSRKYAPYIKIHGFTYVKCAKCGLLYTTQHYSPKATTDFYTRNQYYATTTYANKETYLYRKESVARPKVRFLEQFSPRPKRERKKWLDVGAGIGDMVSVAQENGWEAIGLELSGTSVKFGKRIFGVDLIQKTLGVYAQENPDLIGKFDVVSFIGLLEHTTTPLELLRIAQKLLRKGGYVMIQGPHADSLSCMIQTVYPQNVFRQMNPVDHIMLFSQQSLLTALKKTGFKPVAMWYHGMDIYELLNNLVMTNPKVYGSDFYQIMFKHMNELQLIFDKQELCDRLICVAKVAK